MKRFFWLASYPKSGNTWMRMALASLRGGGGPIDINRFALADETIAASRGTFDQALEIDSSDLTEAEILAARPAAFRITAERLTETAIWKVHEAYIDAAPGEALFPEDVTLGAAYLVRDPRDVAVSLAHHSALSLDRVIGDMGDPSHCLARQRERSGGQLPQPLLDWSSHVESWLDRPPFPVTMIRYEDLLADPAAGLRRIAAAAGLDAPDEAVRGAVAATAFDVLAGQEAEQGFKERSAKAPTFFRRGKQGGWREALTSGQADRITAAHRRVMERLGYL